MLAHLQEKHKNDKKKSIQEYIRREIPLKHSAIAKVFMIGFL
ncbi:hypothetical protein PCC21_003600 [Pectobacterium carotovorum subsp. carotovorum PCC21]|nr:hypothetical protein PCC21_003600 [Pectobacterium carotovorum subsp. carotovorum PCC21]